MHAGRASMGAVRSIWEELSSMCIVKGGQMGAFQAFLRAL